MDEQESTRIPWEEIVALLLRRRTLIVSVFAGGLVTAVILALLQGPTYRASAKLMVTSKRARITVSPDPREGPTVDRVTDQDLNSEVALLQSPSLVREVLEPYLGKVAVPQEHGFVHQAATLVRYPLKLPMVIYRRIHNVAAPSALEGWLQVTVQHLFVNDIKGSNLIQVSFESRYPKWTAEFVNKLVNRHVERHVRMNQQADALGFFESQRQLLSERLRQAEANRAKFYEREQVDSAPEQRTQLRNRLAELRSALANSGTELAEGEARAAYLSAEISSHPRNVLPDRRLTQNDPLQLLNTRIIELELQRNEVLSKYAPTSVKIQEIDRQIEEARRLLANQEKTSRGEGAAANPMHQKLALDLTQTQAQMAAVKARAEALRSQIASDQAKLEHLDQIASEQERLEQEVATAREALLTYSKKVEEARFSDALDASRIVNVSVVEPAETPTAPLPSKQLLILSLGAITSLVVGVGLAFARDRLDPTLKSAAEAAKTSGLPILADISL
jgi:uncharacterized protein involved in exopolysaccharide biosynthesis